MSLNLHEIAGSACEVVNDYQEMLFTKTKAIWVEGSRVPEAITETVTVLGQIQPASSQDLHELGFNIIDFQYFKCFVSFEATQIDRIRQLGCDTFTIGSKKYRIAGKIPWDDAGWREFYCYLDEVKDDAG